MKAKRIIAYLLALFILFTTCSITVSAEAEVINEVDAYTGLLEKLEILNKSESYDPEASISRIEFLTTLLKAIKAESASDSSERQIFFDIDLDSEYYPIISIAYSLGIIKGKPDGRFAPDDAITSTEALVMIIRAAGCEKIALEEGGYPTGYLVCGKRFEFTAEINVNDSEAMKKKTAERMIYNLLTAATVNITKDGITINNDSTLLKNIYHITEARGIVDTNSYANIYGGKRCESGKISIENKLYDVDMEFDGKYIGEKVVYYYNEEKRSTNRKIVYLYPDGSSRTKIDAEDLNYITPNALSYNDETGKERKLEISPDAVVLENSVKVSISEKGYSLPKHGMVSAIKANESSKVNLILVSSEKIGIVKSIANESIYLDGEGTFNYDANEYNSVIIQNGNDEKISIEDIPIQSLAEIAEAPDKERLEIKITNSAKTITIKSFSEKSNNGFPYYVIYDTESNQYTTIRDFDKFSDDNKIASDLTVTALFDSRGRIAAFIKSGESCRYGYLYKYKKETTGFNNDVVFRVFTDEGIFEDIILADKVINIATNAELNRDDILELCSEKQVIKYILNSKNKISKIEFASNNILSEGYKIAGTTPAGSYNETTRYRKDGKLFGGLFALGDDTVIFEIPEDKNSEEDYHILKSDSIVDQSYYPDAVGYTDGNSSIAKAIVLNTVPRVGRDSSRMLVKSVINVYNAKNGKNETALVGMVNGSEKTISAASLSVLDCIVREKSDGENKKVTVNDGDVIRYDLDSDGQISQVLLVFDYSERIPYGQRKTAADSSGNAYIYQIAYGDKGLSWGSDAIHAYGKASRIQDDKYLRFKWYGDAEEDGYSYPINQQTTYIYEYDNTNNKSASVKAVTINDIITEENSKDSEEKILMIARVGGVPLIVIYK